MSIALETLFGHWREWHAVCISLVVEILRQTGSGGPSSLA